MQASGAAGSHQQRGFGHAPARALGNHRAGPNAFGREVNAVRVVAKPVEPPKGVPLTAAQLPVPKIKLVGKAIKPGASEIDRNPRARSAIMRVAEKLAA